MAGRTISQREARRLRDQRDELSQMEDWRANAWAKEWPGGVHLGTTIVTDRLAGAVMASRKLGHAVVVTITNNEVNFYAISLQAKQP